MNPEKNMNRRSSSRTVQRIAFGAVLTTLAMMFSYLEAMFPISLGIPGIKLGLPNLVILIALYRLGDRYAWSINLLRIVLSGLLFGGVSAMLYSLAGGILSLLVMMLLKKPGCFSPVGVSMAGGVMHNFGQLTLAALILETKEIYLYLPVLCISGLITGTILGLVVLLLLRRL